MNDQAESRLQILVSAANCHVLYAVEFGHLVLNNLS